MKRLNPKTGLPFVHGDERDDGMLFRSYNTGLRQDGTFYEKWYSPEAFAEQKVKANQRRKKIMKA